MTDIKNKILKLVNKNNEYVLALSGGVDSAVLASIFKELNLSYRTIFVNHNQKDSSLLQKSAEEIAKNLETSHENIITDLEENASETKMREKRYGLLFDNLKKNEILVTGHHKDDKVETFLINSLALGPAITRTPVLLVRSSKITEPSVGIHFCIQS